MSAEPRSWIRWTVLALALALGVHLRLRGLSELPLYGDEYHTVFWKPSAESADTERVDLASVSYGAILTQFDVVGSHVPLPLLQRLSMDVFGAGIVPFRLVAIVPGLLLLLLAYPLLRAFVSANAAALATAALAVNPMVVYYARFARGYSLALFLALVLGWAVRRVLEPGGRSRRSWSALVASATLLPWVHLSAAGFVLAVALASLALAWRESRAFAARLLAAFALAAGLGVLLFLPVFGQVLAYFRTMQPEDPPLSWMGVPTLLAGGRAAAWLWLALLPLGAGLVWRERRASVVLAFAALLGPLVLLLGTHPRGMDYAWARYVLSPLPFLAALVAAALTQLSARVARTESAGLALGGALLLAQFLGGPLGPAAPRDGSFSNTYLALHELAAFDAPYPATPAFYRQLATDASARRIVEWPWLVTRAVQLHRNYALQHGKQVLAGWTGELPSALQNGPYVRLMALEPGQADYLVVHRDPVAEVPEYFRYVIEDLWPARREASEETFMARQEAIYPKNLTSAADVAKISARLAEKLGAPCYEDDTLLVWKLAR